MCRHTFTFLPRSLCKRSQERSELIERLDMALGGVLAKVVIDDRPHPNTLVCATIPNTENLILMAMCCDIQILLPNCRSQLLDCAFDRLSTPLCHLHHSAIACVESSQATTKPAVLVTVSYAILDGGGQNLNFFISLWNCDTENSFLAKAIK